ncbi:hypothetical protein AB1Y20_007607 [Prymnesium parvum]|uniref:Uncharacterized protein n=1 Tax=Prymnesium parvum TaxID=97485 RepID=A0AB34IY90_PRYPA
MSSRMLRRLLAAAVLAAVAHSARVDPRRRARGERWLASVPMLRMRGGAESASGKLGAWLESKRRELHPAAVTQDADRLKAAMLMKRRGLKNVEMAADLLRAAHKRDPDNVQLKLELADAINTVIRIKTNANSLVLEGTQDCPAFKKIWGTLGRESLPLATDARKAMPNDVKALAVYADAFLYSSSAQGIVKQALTGVGKKYVAMATELYKHPKWDSAVGCAFLGGFYNVAPWPVGNKQKAAKYLREGVSIAPTRRNLYYAGVNAYQLREYDKAVSFFSRALAAPICEDPSSSEGDFMDFILEQSRRGLQLSKQALAGQSVG